MTDIKENDVLEYLKGKGFVSVTQVYLGLANITPNELNESHKPAFMVMAECIKNLTESKKVVILSGKGGLAFVGLPEYQQPHDTPSEVESNMNLRPLPGMVIGKPVIDETTSGLIGVEPKELPSRAVADVCFVHPAEKEIKVGDRVAYLRVSGQHFKFEDQEYVTIPVKEITGKVDINAEEPSSPA